MDKKTREQLDLHLRNILKWHFDDQTGSEFWLQRKANLGFDPLSDISTYADLAQFPDLTDELRTVQVEDLIPRGFRKSGVCPPVSIFESGGATGLPKRIIEIETRKLGVEWLNDILAQQDFPTGDGHFLFVGPTGPHLVGTSMKYLAQLQNAMCYYIDFDPRWVRRCVLNKQSGNVEEYVKHLLFQAKNVLERQNITTLFATPVILQYMLEDSALLSLIQEKIRGVIWAGTHFSSESISFLQEEVLPDATIVGIYGNTLMGIAPQRPHDASDPSMAVFYPFFPHSVVDVVDMNDPNVHVDYLQTGRVKVTLMSREMFLPNNLERDQAIRMPPYDEVFHWDGVAEVRPLPSEMAETVEGVY